MYLNIYFLIIENEYISLPCYFTRGFFTKTCDICDILWCCNLPRGGSTNTNCKCLVSQYMITSHPFWGHATSWNWLWEIINSLVQKLRTCMLSIILMIMSYNFHSLPSLRNSRDPSPPKTSYPLPTRPLWRARYSINCQHLTQHMARRHMINATVDERNPAFKLRLVVIPILYRVSYIPGG